MAVSFCGTWDMVSNINLDGYLTALGISDTVRNIALKQKQKKVIKQEGDLYTIKTLSTFWKYTFSFRMDQEFEESPKGMDKGHCKSLVMWEGSKMVCKQIGEKNRGWAHWIEEDKLHLELHCEDQVCKQVFQKNGSGKCDVLKREVIS